MRIRVDTSHDDFRLVTSRGFVGNSKPGSTAQHLRVFLRKLVAMEAILRRHQMQRDAGAAAGRHTKSNCFPFFRNGDPVDKTETLN